MKQDPNLRVVAVQGNPTWLELMALDKPDHPLKDIRVRLAISLALDRKAVNDAELGGMSSIGGNWIPPDWPLGLDKPVPPTDLAQAKKLLADAGVADGDGRHLLRHVRAGEGAWMKQYDSWVDLQERKRLVEQVQNFILDQYMIVPVCRNVAIWGLNQRLGNKPLEEVVGAVPQYNYLGLYEDLVLKE